MMLDSIWTKDVSLSGFPSLEGDTKTDILIIGGGMAGLLTAHALSQIGANYLLVEADSICGGVTRNTTAKISSQHGPVYQKLLKEFDLGTASLYWQANEDAISQYRHLCKEIPCDFEERSSYLYSVNDPAILAQESAALDRLNIPHQDTRTVSLPFPVAGAIRFRRQAQFHPLKFASHIAKGLNIREHTRALAYEDGAVITNRGRIVAQQIVVTTHFPIFNKHGGYFLKMYQERSYVLGLQNAPRLDGMYRDAAEDGLSFRNYGDYLLLGGGSHRTGKAAQGWIPLEAAAHQYYPDAIPALRWATQDCMTLDGMPYIGQYGKQTPNLYVATGFNKWGMTGSMTAAIVLRDLLQGKEDPYAGIFSPARQILRKQLLVNGFHTVGNFLTPTKPRCPHLGCALKWNPHEHSWDCPCHGSRFSKDGKLLDNPATGDLENNDDRSC